MNQPCLNNTSNPARPEIYLGDRYIQFRKNIAMPIMLGVADAYPFSYNPMCEYVHAMSSQYLFSMDVPFVNRVNSTKIGKEASP